MILVNLADGSTRSVDLSVDGGLRSAVALLASGKVTALVLRTNGAQHALVMPRHFRSRPVYRIEPILDGTGAVIGEYIAAQADDVRVSLTSTFASHMVRCDLVKTGAMRYAPV